jgi:hypothetical protein
MQTIDLRLSLNSMMQTGAKQLGRRGKESLEKRSTMG